MPFKARIKPRGTVSQNPPKPSIKRTTSALSLFSSFPKSLGLRAPSVPKSWKWTKPTWRLPRASWPKSWKWTKPSWRLPRASSFKLKTAWSKLPKFHRSLSSSLSKFHRSRKQFVAKAKQAISSIPRTFSSPNLSRAYSSLANASKEIRNAAVNNAEKKKKIRWTTKAFILFLFGLLMVLFFGTEPDEHEKKKRRASNWEMAFFKKMPLRAVSHWWGGICAKQVPLWLRVPLYKFYAKAFHCNLDEMDAPLESYKTLCEFFNRRLKPGVRKFEDGLTSPCDGTVVVFGEVKDDILEQIKGMKFSMKTFLGGEGVHIPNKKLFHCVFYLDPGDYHCVHSSADWVINQRRHFPGYLFSVSKVAANFIEGLFTMNERVVFTGQWENGFMSMALIGATNVGSIAIPFDSDVKTNQIGQKPGMPYDEKLYSNVAPRKGDDIGVFKLGSSVVLLWESDEFEFAIQAGQKIKLGTSLGVAINKQQTQVDQQAPALVATQEEIGVDHSVQQ